MRETEKGERWKNERDGKSGHVEINILFDLQQNIQIQVRLFT